MKFYDLLGGVSKYEVYFSKIRSQNIVAKKTLISKQYP